MSLQKAAQLLLTRLPVLQAAANGLVIETVAAGGSAHADPGLHFDGLESLTYRVKMREVKTRRYAYRSLIQRHTSVALVKSESEVASTEKHHSFVCWLDDDWVVSQVPVMSEECWPSLQETPTQKVAQGLLSQLPAIRAAAEGKAVQYRDSRGWVDASPCSHGFDWQTVYRIKPALRSRRLLVNGLEGPCVALVTSDKAAKNAEAATSFIRWVDETWQEHEVAS